MPIISSRYKEDAVLQADGRRWIYETHIDHNGIEHTAQYLATSGWDIEATLKFRAENIGETIDRNELSKTESLNFKLNISKYEFLNRLTVEERIACRELAKTDLIIIDFLALLDAAINVNLDDSNLLAGLSYLENKQILKTGRSTEIING